MKDFLECIYAIVNGIIKKLNIKKRKQKTWATSVIFAVVFAVLISAVTCGVYFLYGQEPNGQLVMWGLCAALTIAAVVFIIRGHRKNWDPYG